VRDLKYGPRSKNNTRKAIQILFHFAVSRGYLPKGTTEADEIPYFKQPPQAIGIFKPDEMAALCYQRLGEPDNAETMLMLARTNAPNNPFLKADSLKHNFVAILGIGDGPFKIKARKYMTGLNPEKKVELVVDEGTPGQPAEVTDLLAQAKSQQRGAADNARVARKAGKFILSVALSAATGVNINIEDYDDIRSWHGLPLKLYVFTADVPPGTHTIQLKCYDEKGKDLERYSQIWFDVPVSASSGPVLFLRDFRNAQNHHNVEHVKLNQTQDTPAK
jgi:hypothetical protein